MMKHTLVSQANSFFIGLINGSNNRSNIGFGVVLGSGFFFGFRKSKIDRDGLTKLSLRSFST